MSGPTSLVRLMAIPLAKAVAAGQPPAPVEADPGAAEAFATLVEAYRSRPALQMKSMLKIELVEGEATAHSEEVTAELTWSRGGSGIVSIRGFRCHFDDGVLWAVHEKTDHAYYRDTFEGSPYWSLLIAFQDLPYPHLALLWGEPAMQDVYMQLEPQTPLIVPTEVGAEEVDGAVLQRITLAGPDGSLVMLVDPATKLIESCVHEITGGPFVQPGTKKVTRYRFEYTTFDEPLPADAIRFDPGDRQRVDLLASLLPPPAPAPAGGGRRGGVDLVGAEAPPVVLATMDGGALDLEDLRGKVVVLDFWASWCKPCLRGLPLLHDVADWVRREQLPAAIVTVNVWEVTDPDRNTPDDRLAAASAFWKQHGFTLPVAMDYTDQTAAAFGVQSIPTTFVIRSDGIVQERFVGVDDRYVEELEEAIGAAIDALEAP